VLGHVPFADIKLLALVALERLNFVMFSQVDLKVASCVILFAASRFLALELVKIFMCSLMVTQNPLLTKLAIAPWKITFELHDVLPIVRGDVIGQVLGHLERFVTAFERTFVQSN